MPAVCRTVTVLGLPATGQDVSRRRCRGRASWSAVLPRLVPLHVAMVLIVLHVASETVQQPHVPSEPALLHLAAELVVLQPAPGHGDEPFSSSKRL